MIENIINKTFKLLIYYLAIVAVIILSRLGYNSEIVDIVFLGGFTMIITIASVYLLKGRRKSF